MKIPHSPHHWIAVALVLAVLLLTLSEAHGQSSGAAATFEGRPAMAGAQAGQGAMAGPPQGGIGVQSNTDMPTLRDDVRPPGKDVQPQRDRSLAKDERSAVTKGKRAIKRVVKRSRTGVGDIDTQKTVPVREGR